MDWREIWRLRLAEGAGAPSSGERSPLGERPVGSGGPAEPGSADHDAVRTRFFFVVARTRLDLFLTIRRQFRDDRTVHVMLDRREQDRRGKESPVKFADRRRRTNRRRPVDYWEDTSHHPAVLIPLSRLRQDSPLQPSAELSAPDKEPAMEHVSVEEARVLAWVQEGQHVLQHVLPTVLNERDALRSQLQEATRRCKELQEEADGLRADAARAAAAQRELEQGHADIVDSVGQFLTQLTHVMEPMRGLAEKLAQARHRRDGAERLG